MLETGSTLVAGARVRLCTAEQRLMAAVLEDALRVHRRGLAGLGRPIERRDVAEWFASDEQDHPFAFRTVCEALGIDANAVRAVLLARDGVDPLAA